ncbi:MAG: hypothetical protein EOM20_20925 [Spartobacteria bacterium]|nr:hypothetical protein [Spartobacteria bacterium]
MSCFNDFEAHGPTDLTEYWPIGDSWYIRSGESGPVLENWDAEDPYFSTRTPPTDSFSDVDVYTAADGTWYVRYTGGGYRAQAWGLIV